jgi:hypothetical protein
VTPNSPLLSEKVIDFTRYDRTVWEPVRKKEGEHISDWSILGQINQKGTRPQDKPVGLSELLVEDQKRIFKRYPELKL